MGFFMKKVDVPEVVTLRQYFACQTFQTLLGHFIFTEVKFQKLAKDAYRLADLMIEEGKKDVL